jgi:hypothetical protein
MSRDREVLLLELLLQTNDELLLLFRYSRLFSGLFKRPWTDISLDEDLRRFRDLLDLDLDFDLDLDLDLDLELLEDLWVDDELLEELLEFLVRLFLSLEDGEDDEEHDEDEEEDEDEELLDALSRPISPQREHILFPALMRHATTTAQTFPVPFPVQ